MTPAPQLSLPAQMASQAEFIVNNLTQTDYQHVDKEVYQQARHRVIPRL